MGQKINPTSFRLRQHNLWQSRWFATKDYGKFTIEDYEIRKIIEDKYSPHAGIGSIEVERNNKDTVIIINTSRPGILIGRAGAGINQIKEILNKKFGHNFKIEAKELKKPDLIAKLVSENISSQIVKRINFRRAAKAAMEKTIQAGAVGIKINVSGRLNGAEIARTEKFSAGTVSLSSIKNRIDYYLNHTNTVYGVIGIKVWINLGEGENADS